MCMFIVGSSSMAKRIYNIIEKEVRERGLGDIRLRLYNKDKDFSDETGWIDQYELSDDEFNEILLGLHNELVNILKDEERGMIMISDDPRDIRLTYKIYVKPYEKAESIIK